MNLEEATPPVCTRTIERVTVENEDLRQLADMMNSILGGIKTRSEIPEWMVGEARKSVTAQGSRIDTAVHTVRKVDEKVVDIERKMAETCKQSEASAEKFEQAGKVLNDVLQEHNVLKKDFDALKKRVDDERSGNQILLLIVIVLSIVVAFRVMRKKR
jgi:hypothetical protein